LGSLVKTAVLRRLAAELPAVQRITTYNSESNTPMVAVNEALGFRPAGRFSAWSTRVPGA
jgi:RimJ/RimL family protein N-acetyltransferase